MNSQKLILLFLVLLVTSSCKQNYNSKNNSHLLKQDPEKSFYIEKDHPFIKNCSNIFFAQIKCKIEDNKLIFGGYDEKCDSLKFFITDLKTGQQVYKPYEGGILNVLRKPYSILYFTMFPKGGYGVFNHRFMITYSDSLILQNLINLNPYSIEQRAILPILPSFIGDYNHFYASNYGFKYPFFLLENRIKYYKESYGFEYKHTKDTSIRKDNIGIKYPSNYAFGPNYFVLPYFYMNSSDNQNIIASFPHNDSVFFYKNGKCVDQKFFGTKYEYQINEIPDEYAMDMNKQMKFSKGEPNYHEIYYDPYRNLYYRIFLHRAKYIETEVKKTFNKTPWSLIIADKDFNIKEEIYFDDNKDTLNLMNNSIVCSEDGIWMHGTKTINDKKSIYFNLYNLELDESEN
ncbi:MAG: DUF4221 family protein [Bacteroidales bacterium]